MSNQEPNEPKRLDLQSREEINSDELVDASIAALSHQLRQLKLQRAKLLNDTNNFDERMKSLETIEKFLKRKTSAQKSKGDITTFTLIDTENPNQKLTPRLLSSRISPYLSAINDIQQVINELLGKDTTEAQIKIIKQNSPLSVSLDGAAEAIQVVQEAVIPWRRKHAEIMTQLLEQEKLAEIESKKAEILEKRAEAAKSRAEADKLKADVFKQNEEVKKLQLENEKLQLELHREKIQLTLDIVNLIAPNLSETERISYLVKLLPPLDVVIYNKFEIDKSETAGYR